ncbi:hypothetical protein LCGC14_2994840, partial [marine sediment metagenome]
HNLLNLTSPNWAGECRECHAILPKPRWGIKWEICKEHEEIYCNCCGREYCELDEAYDSWKDDDL